ncbi:MAG: DUF4129 domain-containing protein [Herpetosiphonaceae bacterium]|nr:DUF4129 domain-containing protein [Herpetosiphonaceae bacterium]
MNKMNFQSFASSLQPLRCLFYIVVAAFESSRAYLVILLLATLFGPSPVKWFALLLVVGFAAASAARWPIEEIGTRWPISIALIIVTVWATKWQVLGGILPWQGWSRLHEVELGGVYITLLTTLWCWWRGLSLLDHDHGTLVHTFRRSILTVVIGGLLIGLVNAFQASTFREDRPLLLTAVAMFGLALVSLILARLVADAEAGVITDRWRWLRNGVGVTLLLLFVGVSCLALFSASAANVLRGAMVAMMLLMLIIATPLVWLLAPIGTWIASHARSQITPPPPPVAPPDQILPDSSAVLRYVLQVPLYLIILLPLVVMILAIIFFQRRRKQVELHGDEAHESLFSWAAVADDLRGLWARRQTGGLQALLQSLRATDPATRIRRRYIQALLLGEAAAHGRQLQQTPAEYRPDLSAALPNRDDAVQALTGHYQQARYAPAATTEADAQGAEAAWQALAARENQA